MEGDAWCLSCSSWEALGRELCVPWDSVGCRAVASDLIVNTTRQVRALRSLGAGLSRAPPEAGSPRASTLAGGSRAEARTELKEARRDYRPELPRKRSRSARRSKEEVETAEEDEEEEEEEEEEPSPHHRPVKGSDRRPPEPEGPPPGRKSEAVRGTAGKSRAGPPTRHRDDRERRRRGDQHSRRRTRRAGRKHQRLHRLARNPWLVVHRKQSSEALRLSIEEGGRAHLERGIHLGHGGGSNRC